MKIKKLENKIMKYISEENLTVEEVPVFFERLMPTIMENLLPDDNTIYLLKKNNKLQKYDREKYINGISSAAKDVSFQMLDSDLNNVANHLELILNKMDKRVYKTSTIRSLTIDTLNKMNFKDVASSFEKFKVA